MGRARAAPSSSAGPSRREAADARDREHQQRCRRLGVSPLAADGLFAAAVGEGFAEFAELV